MPDPRRSELLEFARERAAGKDSAVACVRWPFATNPDGYGRIEIARRARPAHQVVLELAGQPKPYDGAEVRHLCPTPNRLCVNLQHLRWGTKSENQRDLYELHGGSMAGENNRRAILTWPQVRDIRARLASGTARARDLAAEFGVSRAAISAIKYRATWAHDPLEGGTDA